MAGNCPEMRKDENGKWTVRLDQAAQTAFVRWLCMTYAVSEEVAFALRGAKYLVVAPPK